MCDATLTHALLLFRIHDQPEHTAEQAWARIPVDPQEREALKTYVSARAADHQPYACPIQHLH